MKLVLKIAAIALSAIAIITGIVLSIPASRAFIVNTVAKNSKVYEEQINLNQELQSENTVVANEIVNLQNQKTELEEMIEIFENDSTVDKQTIQDYKDQVEQLNNQIQTLENIRADVNNGSITYWGSYNNITYCIFDDYDNIMYQTGDAGTHYNEYYYDGITVKDQIDYYVSVTELMNKSLTLNADNALYGYNVYQIVIGPYGIMWDQYNNEYRFAAGILMDLKFTLDDQDISIDDLRNVVEDFNPYILKVDYSYSLDNDGLISEIACNFKVTSN